MASCKSGAPYLSVCLQIISHLTKRLWGQKNLKLKCRETLPIGDQSKVRKIKLPWNQRVKKKQDSLHMHGIYAMRVHTSYVCTHTRRVYVLTGTRCVYAFTHKCTPIYITKEAALTQRNIAYRPAGFPQFILEIFLMIQRFFNVYYFKIPPLIEYLKFLSGFAVE